MPYLGIFVVRFWETMVILETKHTPQIYQNAKFHAEMKNPCS